MRSRALRGLAFSALLGTVLGGCATGSLDANSVCFKPGPEQVQRAPMYQCKGDMNGRSLVN